MNLRRLTSLFVIAGFLGASPSVLPLLAAASEEINQLQAEIQNRKAEIEMINNRLEEYKDKIAGYKSQSASLQRDVALLENEIAMRELDIAAAQNEIESEELEIQIIDSDIESTDAKLAKERDLLATMIFELDKHERSGDALQLLVGAKTFDDVFTVAAQLENVNGDLKKALAATQLTKQQLLEVKSERADKLAKLAELELTLEKAVADIEARRNAKLVLIGQTESSEEEYRALLQDLRAEQQGITATIAELQRSIEDRLAEADQSGDTSIISWPLRGIITTTFYDPTYPFRYLFEHSGLDIAVPQGTAIGASAPGVVAWVKTGKQYGNYVMIIHANGMSTLYAHMSRMDVKQDEYVTRGQVIGLSGGKPGTQGAGFSTGPHLHFELRKNGIPVDPMDYLTD